MAFIPDNISVHFHPLEDKYPIKTKMAAVSWLIFHENNKSVSAKIITDISLSILSAEKGQKFSSCGAHFRSGDNIFSVQIATTPVCITRKMHLYRNLSRFLGQSLDFSSVCEGS